MLGILDRINLVHRIHEAWKRALYTRHLVGRVIVIAIRLSVLEHTRQVQCDFLGKALAGVQIVVIVLMQSVTESLQVGKQLVGAIRVSVIKMGIVAIDAHRLQEAERRQGLRIAKSHLYHGAIQVSPEQEWLVGVPLVGSERTHRNHEYQNGQT